MLKRAKSSSCHVTYKCEDEYILYIGQVGVFLKAY